MIKGIRELTGARINISANPGSNDGEEDRDPHYRLVRHCFVVLSVFVWIGRVGGFSRWIGWLGKSTAAHASIHPSVHEPSIDKSSYSTGERVGRRLLRVLRRRAHRAPGG